MKKRKIIAVITDVLGDRVVVGADELEIHARKHFPNVPRDIVLEFIERILKDPLVVYEERASHLYHLFYRVDDSRYVVVVVKRSQEGAYFASVYPTGTTVRGKHKRLKKVKL